MTVGGVVWLYSWGVKGKLNGENDRRQHACTLHRHTNRPSCTAAVRNVPHTPVNTTIAEAHITHNTPTCSALLALRARLTIRAISRNRKGANRRSAVERRLRHATRTVWDWRSGGGGGSGSSGSTRDVSVRACSCERALDCCPAKPQPSLFKSLDPSLLPLLVWRLITRNQLPAAPNALCGCVLTHTQSLALPTVGILAVCVCVCVC